VDADLGDIHILAASIALADDGFLKSAAEQGVGKAEQINRTSVLEGIARAIIPIRADGKSVTCCIQGYLVESVTLFQSSHINILAATVACANRSLQRAAVETAVTETEQVNRA